MEIKTATLNKNKKLSMFEILEGFFYFLNEGTKIKYNPEKIHRAIYELKKEHPFLLENFVFGGEPPYCDNINLSLAIMHGILLSYHSQTDTYIINRNLIQHFEQETKAKFTQEQLSELEIIAGKFYQKIR